MTSQATACRCGPAWVVFVRFGDTVETKGPYRWHWTARLVAWWENGEH